MAIDHLRTHAIGLLGAVVFLVLGLPIPWLFGPMAACLLAALSGVRLVNFKPLSDGMRTILGVAAGATFTWAIVQSLPAMWTTLIFVPVMTIAIGFLGIPYFTRICKYDFPTAYYSAMPGGLQDMLIFGEEAGGNVRSLSLIHATRVVVIVTALPVILSLTWSVDLSNPPGAPVLGFDVWQLVLLTACAIVGWRVAKAVGMFGASILGPMILAACMSISGVLTSRPPAEAVWLAQYFIAIGIGAKYVGVTKLEIRRDIFAGLGFCVILLILTLIVVVIVQSLGLAAPLETILSLAPGGQAELVVLALIVGADLGFVVAHHILRIFLVILGAPIAARIFNPPPQG